MTDVMFLLDNVFQIRHCTMCVFIPIFLDGIDICSWHFEHYSFFSSQQ